MRSAPEALAEDLQAMLDHSMDSDTFRSRHPNQQQDAVIETILCQVEHYLADADIRDRNSDYAALQTTEMKKLISLLRSGDLDSAAGVHFLGHSK